MATPTAGIPSGVLNDILSALFLAVIIGGFLRLQGVINGQAIFYFRNNQSDPCIMKYLVFFVWVTNVLHLFLVAAAVYMDLVDGRGDIDKSERLYWSEMAIVLVSAVSDLGVKGTFSYRVWRLSQQWILSFLILIGAFVTFGFSLFLVITMIKAPDEVHNRVGTFGSLITLAMSDIIMSAVLTVVFWNRRSVFPSVNRVLGLVILYTVETSIVTSVGATAGVVMYALLPDTQIFTAILWILPHLILSSLLVALNARAGLRERQRSAIVLSPIVRSRASDHRSVDPTRTWQSRP